MDALVRIDADRAGVGKPERAARLHPFVEEVVHQSLAQLELERFDEPPLRHVEDQQNIPRSERTRRAETESRASRGATSAS